MFASEVIAAAKAHAIAEFPREACGLVVGRMADEHKSRVLVAGAAAVGRMAGERKSRVLVAGQYIACRNRAAEPERAFRIDAEDYLAAGDRLAAVVHSHTAGQDWPTAADMRGQLDTAVPWGIIVVDGPRDVNEDTPSTGSPFATGWRAAARTGEMVAREPFWFGDGVPTPPILGRRFRHGVTDCYSLIRDAFRLGRGGLAAQGIPGWPHEPILLPEFPRDPEWWNSGGNFYEEGFAKAGFARIDITTARAGDVLLAQVQSPVVNHGFVLLEGGIILHHIANRAGDRVSNREPVARWMKFVTYAVRCTAVLR